MSEYCDNCGQYGFEGLCDHCSGRFMESEGQSQTPDIVPCFKCNCQMYQECHAPEGNICKSCTSTQD